MAKMGYDGAEAVASLKLALDNNTELNEIFTRTGRDIDAAFNDAGAIVGGELGKFFEKYWVEGDKNFFINTLIAKAEAFLLEKVKPIIEEQEAYMAATEHTYGELKRPE